jgi:hypothetical protein
MNSAKNCKYCHETFTPRRRNHLYCTTSCKTMASYKRNNYKYISGHYITNTDLEKGNSKLALPNSLNNQIINADEKGNMIEFKQDKNGLNASTIKNSVAGTLIADASVYGLKKILAPQTLPATKGDIEKLKKDIEELKVLVFQFRNNF